jgi:dihydrofolate reductase
VGQLIVSCGMTVDGVIDQTDKWFIPSGSHEDQSRTQLFEADALVLGRITYEGLARVWPTISDDRGFADRINSMPKHVASRTLSGPMRWNATLIEGEVSARVSELKQEQNLVVYGCGELALTLARAGLVDEIRLSIYPTVLRTGARLFYGDDAIKLNLVSTTMYDSGVVMLTYRPELTS